MTTVITGASKGIGFAIADKLARAYPNGNLAICARNSKEVAAAADRLQAIAPHLSIFATTCDVASQASVKGFASQVEARFGTTDILVNNAGFGIFKSVEQMTEEEFDGIMETNLRGTFIVTKAFLRGMRQQRSGTIVTIGSLAGKNGFVGGGAYCASKFGVRGLMQSLFLDVREENIRVVTLFPGSVDTDFFIGVDSKNVESQRALSTEDVAECVMLAVSLPSGATVSELDIRPTNPKGT